MQQERAAPSQPAEPIFDKPAFRRAQRAALKAQGITKSGNTKRKSRAARNVSDQIRLVEAEAKIEEFTARFGVISALIRELKMG